MLEPRISGALARRVCQFSRSDLFTPTSPIAVFNVDCKNTTQQPFWSWNDSAKLPLHQLFQNTLFWCDENDPICKYTRSLYQQHIRNKQEEKKRKNKSTRPHYESKPIAEKDAYDILNEKVQALLNGGDIKDIQNYIKNEITTIKNIPQNLTQFFISIVHAYILVGREMKITDIEQRVLKHLKGRT